jgi:hypothetical protein
MTPAPQGQTRLARAGPLPTGRLQYQDRDNARVRFDMIGWLRDPFGGVRGAERVILADPSEDFSRSLHPFSAADSAKPSVANGPASCMTP